MSFRFLYGYLYRRSTFTILYIETRALCYHSKDAICVYRELGNRLYQRIVYFNYAAGPHKTHVEVTLKQSDNKCGN